jgi:hypothetical protein
VVCLGKPDFPDRLRLAISCVSSLIVFYWPIATGGALTADRRFRGIADMAGPASLPGPVAIVTHGNHNLAVTTFQAIGSSTAAAVAAPVRKECPKYFIN